MPPKSAPMTQAVVRRMIKESVDAAITAEQARHVNDGNHARAVKLRRWFEKTKMTFGISEYVEDKKVKFAAATLRGPALTWWNSKVVILGLDVANQMGWIEMKKLMTREFCPAKELMVELESVKIDSYIRGLSDNNKSEVTSSRPANLNEAVRMAHKLMEQKAQARNEIILEGNKQNARSVERFGTRQGHTRNRCPKKVKQEKVGEVRGRAYVIKDVKPQGSDRSFVDTRFSSMLDIELVKIHTSYEVELADRRIVNTNIVIKGCTLNLVNHLFEIDLMPIELGTFDVIIGMDWLVQHDAVNICGEKVVRIPYRNKMLTVESNKGMSRLKIISCIKVRKYIERGCHFLLAHVTEKNPKEKRLEDVPVIRDFLEVFPDDLPRLPPPRQVEFRIDLADELLHHEVEGRVDGLVEGGRTGEPTGRVGERTSDQDGKGGDQSNRANRGIDEVPNFSTVIAHQLQD
ncbi:putative reverse transcriptase domain-containing protein [Tanacetum coccineum]